MTYKDCDAYRIKGHDGICMGHNAQWCKNCPCKDNYNKARRQEDVSKIMNLINSAISEIGYEAVGYDNTGEFLQVMIDVENCLDIPPVSG